MDDMRDTGVVAGPAPGRAGHTHRLRGLAATGFIATLAAVVATTLAAALARAVGVDFEVAAETIPLSGFAVVTGFFSVVASPWPPPSSTGACAPTSVSCGRRCR